MLLIQLKLRLHELVYPTAQGDVGVMTGLPEPLESIGRQVQAEIRQKTGIPVGIGIATTKTLAKLANAAEWAMRRELLSPAYTTNWKALLTVKAR